MRSLLYALSLFVFGFFNSGFSSVYNFKIQPRSYLFSTHYDLYSKDTYLNSIEQNSLQLHRVYSLCDEKEEVARGTARLFSMGAFFNCLKEIDVVDTLGRKFGFIKGFWMTTASAKFAFYNDNGMHIATAFFDRSGSNISIVDAVNERSSIAIFRRSFIPGGDYFWDVTVLKDEVIDPRLLYIFSAFITDICWPAAPQEKPPRVENTEDSILYKILMDETE